jgi:hypothetical protein
VKIDRRMNLVVPILDDEGKTEVAYVHSVPLAEADVERNFELLGQTFAAIFNRGLGAAAGPGVAARLLKRIAIADGLWETREKGPGPAQLMLEEIRRLTNVIVPGEPGKGWQQLPIQVAVDTGKLSDEDRAEVENAIVFFIAVSATLPRAQRREMLESAAALWGARLSSSTSTELASSLKTSTGDVNIGANPPAPASGASASVNATVDGKPVSVPR